jgi:hypothetical protein
MNHHWHHDTCIKCGITRKKKKGMVIKFSLEVTPAGALDEKPATKVLPMWNYSRGGFERPDCPDLLAA